MPKMTKKYSGALAVARSLGANTSGQTQEALYSALAFHDYQWDSKRGEWLYAPPELAEPPSDLVRVRVWAAHDEVNGIAAIVAAALTQGGLNFVEHSDPYPCRPPKQSESRVYLTFALPKEMGL